MSDAEVFNKWKAMKGDENCPPDLYVLCVVIVCLPNTVEQAG
jgi:hypothetical protein